MSDTLPIELSDIAGRKPRRSSGAVMGRLSPAYDHYDYDYNADCVATGLRRPARRRNDR